MKASSLGHLRRSLGSGEMLRSFGSRPEMGDEGEPGISRDGRFRRFSHMVGDFWVVEGRRKGEGAEF